MLKWRNIINFMPCFGGFLDVLLPAHSLTPLFSDMKGTQEVHIWAKFHLYLIRSLRVSKCGMFY